MRPVTPAAMASTAAVATPASTVGHDTDEVMAMGNLNNGAPQLLKRLRSGSVRFKGLGLTVWWVLQFRV